MKPLTKLERWRSKQRLHLKKLRENPCTDCGVQYPHYVMDFDHARGVKEFGIGRTIANPVSKERLEKEIAKCDLLCANCHRIRTHKRLNGM